MEFREFRNPTERDYDINNSLYHSNNNVDDNTACINELTSIIGILEDIDEDELYKKYGITLHEYFYPDKEVINKVKFALANSFHK